MNKPGLNKKQIEFLDLINKGLNKCIRSLGRQIYNTDVTCYNVRNKFLSDNLIYIENLQNKEVPHLTKKGKKLLVELSNNLISPNI